MRKLMWFTIGFGAASAFCSYVWVTEWLLVPAILFAAAFAALLLGSRWVKCFRFPAAVCMGIALGLGWFQLYSDGYLAKAEALNGQIADVTARCTDYSYETAYGSAVDGILYLDGKSYRARFYVSGKIDMEPGDVLTGAFRFKVTTPEGELETTSYQGKGMFLLAYQVENAELTRLVEPPKWAFPAILRETLLNLIEQCFPDDAAPFAKALLLGDRTDIDYETNTAFQVSGIMHIIAVSGLHVTILFTLVYNACFRRRWLVALVGLPALVLFAFVGGLSPSIVRACIMQGLMILAMLFDREYDGPSELAFACLVMFVCNPLVITSVSFQLSVGCMIGIFLFQKNLCEWMTDKLITKERPRFAGAKRWLARSVSMTLSSMSLTTPLVAWYFGTVSLVGILTNLLTLWVISFIFYGIMLVCLTGWLWPVVGTLLASLISWPVRYVLLLSESLAAFPLSAVYTRSYYILAWLMLTYVLFGVFLRLREKKPAIFAGCIAFGLCLAVAASWIEPLTDSCRMTVLNVGQGQSIILQSEGKTYLVDCGGSYDEDAADLAAQTLLSQGVARLDGVILTHFDRDHSGGIGYLLSRIPADTVFVPDYEDDSGTAAMLEKIMPGSVHYVQNDLLLTYGDTKISVFGPVVPDSGNESSLAVLFQKENCDILITGDRSDFGERMLLKTAEIPDLEILVAGHHGSKHSTCEELLAATTPEIVVISVGENNYGHPAQEMLDRLTKYGCTVYRTDIHGNITLRR